MVKALITRKYRCLGLCHLTRLQGHPINHVCHSSSPHLLLVELRLLRLLLEVDARHVQLAVPLGQVLLEGRDALALVLQVLAQLANQLLTLQQLAGEDEEIRVQSMTDEEIRVQSMTDGDRDTCTCLLNPFQYFLTTLLFPN